MEEKTRNLIAWLFLVIGFGAFILLILDITGVI